MAVRRIRVAVSMLERILVRGECFEPINVPTDLKILGVRNVGFGHDKIEVWCESASWFEDVDHDLTPELNHLDLPELEPLFAPQYRRVCPRPPLT